VTASDIAAVQVKRKFPDVYSGLYMEPHDRHRSEIFGPGVRVILVIFSPRLTESSAGISTIEAATPFPQNSQRPGSGARELLL